MSTDCMPDYPTPTGSFLIASICAVIMWSRLEVERAYQRREVENPRLYGYFFSEGPCSTEGRNGWGDHRKGGRATRLLDFKGIRKRQIAVHGLLPVGSLKPK